MQKRLESLSGYRVCYERIPALKRIATDQQGTYRFDRSKGHIIGLYEEGDGFDELRAAMEVSHGLLFFDGYPGVLGSPGEVCALVTDTIQHPAMRAILRSNNLEETFDRYYEDRMKTWIRDAGSLSDHCNASTDVKIRYAFFFLEAMLIASKFRLLLQDAFASSAGPTWSIADNVYATVSSFYPTDQLRLRKALVHCLTVIEQLGKETRFVVVPPVIEEKEKGLLALKVFEVEDKKRSHTECIVMIRYRGDGTVGTVVDMSFSELEAFRSWLQSCSASDLSGWVNASWRGKDLDSVLAKPTGSE